MNHRWEMNTDLCKRCGITVTDYWVYKKGCRAVASCCGGAPPWNIDKSQWECEKCKSAVSNDPSYLYAPGSTIVSVPKDYQTLKKEHEARKRVCGGAKANTTHAHWCEAKN